MQKQILSLCWCFILVSPVKPIKEELKSFAESIKNNKPTAVTEIDGYLAMEVAHKILNKISNNSIMV